MLQQSGNQNMINKEGLFEAEGIQTEHHKNVWLAY